MNKLIEIFVVIAIVDIFASIVIVSFNKHNSCKQERIQCNEECFNDACYNKCRLDEQMCKTNN